MPDILDTAAWPIVHYTMPNHVPAAEAGRHIAAFDALLARGEPYALIFSGAELPQDSKHFMTLYARWGKQHFAEQKRLCRGAIRVEPDVRKRESFWRKAMLYLSPAAHRIPTALSRRCPRPARWRAPGWRAMATSRPAIEHPWPGRRATGPGERVRSLVPPRPAARGSAGRILVATCRNSAGTAWRNGWDWRSPSAAPPR